MKDIFYANLSAKILKHVLMVFFNKMNNIDYKFCWVRT